MKATSYLIKLASSLENKYSSEEDFNSAISPDVERKRLENARKQLEAEKIKKRIADAQAEEDAQTAIEQARKYHEFGQKMSPVPPKSQSLSEKEILKKLLEQERSKNQELKLTLTELLDKEREENLRLKYESPQSFEEEQTEESPSPKQDLRLIPDRSYNY